MTTSRADATAFLNFVADSDDPQGVAVELPDRNSATAFNQVLNRTRAEARKESTKFFKPDDPAYNKSAWDFITFRIRPHPTLNPEKEPQLPWIIIATSSEHLIRQLKMVNPITGEPLNVDLTEDTEEGLR